jgi:hypothetical protein
MEPSIHAKDSTLHRGHILKEHVQPSHAQGLKERNTPMIAIPRNGGLNEPWDRVVGDRRLLMSTRNKIELGPNLGRRVLHQQLGSKSFHSSGSFADSIKSCERNSIGSPHPSFLRPRPKVYPHRLYSDLDPIVFRLGDDAGLVKVLGLTTHLIFRKSLFYVLAHTRKGLWKTKGY